MTEKELADKILAIIEEKPWQERTQAENILMACIEHKDYIEEQTMTKNLQVGMKCEDGRYIVFDIDKIVELEKGE